MTTCLLDSVREAYGEEVLASFQANSRKFAKRQLTADDFLVFLLSTFGHNRATKVLPLLSALLPDDALRDDLRRAWRQADKKHQQQI